MRFSLAIAAAALAAFGDVAAASYSNATSVIAITTCIPTTIYSTIAVEPTSSSMPAPMGTGSSGTTVSPVASGTGSGPTYSATISPSIAPYTGAASSNMVGSMAAVGVAAVAAFVMA